jgi:putative acetyltransferase
VQITIASADVRDADVVALVDALTAELAQGGYPPEEMFGYSAEKLAAGPVHLLGARDEGRLVAIGGIELQDGDTAELKRMYVVPDRRGSGVADALMEALVGHARRHAVRLLRLETGDAQHAALRYYRRHGFVDIPRFGPYVDSTTSVCLERDLSAG